MIVEIPTEPIGSIPRPDELIAAWNDRSTGRISQEQFDKVAERALSGEGDVRARTVHDLLARSQNRALFGSTFAVVGRSVDMDHALVAMNAIPGCQDVFVTADGTSDSAVVGWLTNAMYLS